jgi:predicted N-formylglutamate amidohydrolase
MARHIAYDVGAAEVAHGLSAQIDAALAVQPYSRLVIDCNRPRYASDLTPAMRDGSTIPFNQIVDEAERQTRWQTIHQPFHRAVTDLLDTRGPVALVAVHSFTPQMRNSAPRTMAAGLLVRQDHWFAETLRQGLLEHEPNLAIVFNAPYTIDDESDYTIPVHGEARRLPHVLLEIRNDLITDPTGVQRWVDLLSAALERILTRYLQGYDRGIRPA